MFYAYVSTKYKLCYLSDTLNVHARVYLALRDLSNVHIKGLGFLAEVHYLNNIHLSIREFKVLSSYFLSVLCANSSHMQSTVMLLGLRYC